MSILCARLWFAFNKLCYLRAKILIEYVLAWENNHYIINSVFFFSYTIVVIRKLDYYFYIIKVKFYMNRPKLEVLPNN
jgi:hypothetical protein